MPIMSERRNETLFQESPASVLRYRAYCVAIQMSPLLSTASAPMANRSGGFDGSQCSPPLTETARLFRPATTIIFSETLMATGLVMPGTFCLCQVSPESALKNKPAEV